MEIKKYEFTNETLSWKGHTLHRIKALRDFGNIRTGDLGGWVEREENLDHYNNCWVCQNAKVYDNAVVKGNAKVCGLAQVYGNASVSHDAKVYGHAEVYGYAIVKDNAEIYSYAQVYGKAEVFGEANVCGYAIVCDEAWIFGWGWVCDNAQVYDNARVFGHAMVGGNVWVCGLAQVYGYAQAYDNAKVCGDVLACGNAVFCGDAVIKEAKDYAVFKNAWSSGRFFTWTRSNDKWKVGCFYGTGEELIKKAYADGELKGKCYEAIVQMQNKISELLK